MLDVFIINKVVMIKDFKILKFINEIFFKQ